MVLAKKDDFTKMTQFPTCIASTITWNFFFLSDLREEVEKRRLEDDPYGTK